ncbi:MAG TPA: CHAD domain-containing protein [Candidatus Acidoferrales bacterium]|nr:CHAD domain-containing protein [Candidatus Acidoferrales bacterium]
MRRKENAAAQKAAPANPDTGLGHWAPRVIKERKKAAKELTPENVHDLRTALRRCLSIEDALSRFDPHPDWKKLKRAAKKLLKSLGGLRDSDVLLEWLDKLEIAKDSTGLALRNSIAAKRDIFKQEAIDGLNSFDQQKWKSWAEQLTPRADSFSPDGAELRYVALEQWHEAYERHRFAMRSRSKVAYHRTRVALKKLRYTAENFLPVLQAKWDGEPKELQNLLGEVHDLDVLWGKLVALKPAIDREAKSSWKSAINSERKKRLKQYVSKTSGKKSLWAAWRELLPSGADLERAAVAELAAWSRFRTPEFIRQRRVAALAADLFDSLDARGFTVGLPTERARYIVQGAALLEDSGRIDGDKSHHKNSYRLIRKLPLPLGWKPAELQLMAVVARYHRKALPQAKHKEFSVLPSPLQQATLLLAGILRLANAFEQAPNLIRKLHVDVTLEGLMIRAYGFDGEEPFLSKLATAKHLLEIACRRAIVITPGAAGAPLRVVEAKERPKERTDAAD